MATSGHDPLTVPPQFWQRPDVTQALQARDIARLFRLLRQYCGASQTRIGTAVGMTQSTVSLIVNRNKPVTTMAVLERIADGLAMPDESRMRLGLAPKEMDVMRRRTALGIGLIGALSPGTLTAVLRDSAAEAFEFTRERAVSAVGKGTLDHLTAVIVELDRAYPWRPAAELFPIARVYRHRVEGLINGRHTLAEARELYVHGAYLSHLLADLAYDLGSTLTAKAYAIDSQQLAEHAGHGELYGWAADTLADLERYRGAAEKAAKTALDGLDRVPRQHPLAALLRNNAARSFARQGDRTAAAELLAEARVVCEQLPDEMPSRFSTVCAENIAHTIANSTAECHLGLNDWKEAEQHARMGCGVAQWSPGQAALAQLRLGLALAHLGHPDEAAERGRQALALERGYGSMLTNARKLDAALRGRYPKEPGTLEFHERLERFDKQAIGN
jgi:tetratricopeptide (TPR) repeat protein